MRRAQTTPPRVVAVMGNKGGVGRTTVVAHVLPALVDLVRAAHGDTARVLVIDASTGGTTFALTGRALPPTARTITDVLTGQAALTEVLLPLDGPVDADQSASAVGAASPAIAAARTGVDLIPCDERAATLMPMRTTELGALRSQLHHPRALPSHPVVLIDGGPASTALNRISIVAADETVGVIQPNAWDAAGLNLLIRDLNVLAESFGHVHLAGVIANLVGDGIADQGALNDFSGQLGPRLWTPHIPYAAALRRANNLHLPVAAMRPTRPELVAAFGALAERLYPPTARPGSRPRRRRS